MARNVGIKARIGSIGALLPFARADVGLLRLPGAASG